MNLSDRWNAKESKIGKIFKKYVSLFFLLCAAIGASTEYLAGVPVEWIPTWLKEAVPVAGVISFVVGKMTVLKDGENSD